MRNAQKGSMLLEALIALGLTSFLTIAITRITGDVAKSISMVKTTAQNHQKVIAVTNQLERDLSSLVIIHVTQNAEDKNNPDEKATETPKKKKISRALMGQADHNDTIKIEKKDFPTFKLINGLTTSPLESYGENKPHLVRFSYKIIHQTPEPPHTKKRAFKLYRKETIDLDDLNLKKDGELKDSQIATSSEWILICDNISDFFIQYSTYASETKSAEPATGGAQGEKARLEHVHSFTWPIKKLGEDFKQRIPHSISIVLRLWNPDFTKTFDYQRIIPCMAYASTLPENTVKPSANTKKTADQKPSAQPDNKTIQESPIKNVPALPKDSSASETPQRITLQKEVPPQQKQFEYTDNNEREQPNKEQNQRIISAQKEPSPQDEFEQFIENIPQQKLDAIALRLSQMSPEETENFHALSQALEANPELMQKITSDPEFMEHAREMFK